MGSTWSLHINWVRLIVQLQPLIEVHPAPASVRSVILNHVTGTYSTYTTSPPPGRALFHLTSIVAPLNDPFISETTGANENPAHSSASGMNHRVSAPAAQMVKEGSVRGLQPSGGGRGIMPTYLPSRMTGRLREYPRSMRDILLHSSPYSSKQANVYS